MFYVYIIYSSSRDRFYIGHTENVEQRLATHILRKNLGAADWELRYTEYFISRADAMKRETEIKKKKSRKFIESLIPIIERPA